MINGNIEFYADKICYHYSLFIYIFMFVLNMLYHLTIVIDLSYHLISSVYRFLKKILNLCCKDMNIISCIARTHLSAFTYSKEEQHLLFSYK